MSVIHTKNRQCPDEDLCIPIPKIRNSPICPVSAPQSHVKNFSFTPHTPASLVQDNSIIRSLTADELRPGIKSFVSLLQLDPSFYSTLSLRRDSATFAFRLAFHQNSSNSKEKMALTGIRSYLTLPLKDHIRFCSQIAEKITSLDHWHWFGPFDWLTLISYLFFFFVITLGLEVFDFSWYMVTFYERLLHV